MIKEQLGQAEDKTQLPDEYIELEKRVDALKLVHQKLLQVTSQYSNEAYDYPPNIRESFNDLGRTINEKVQLLSQAGSPAEAQAALTAPPSAKPQPKTFNHAIARASLAGSQTLAQSTEGEDPLATALEKYALAEEQVGEARLAQDAQIQSRFLAGWNTTLNTNLMFAAKARKNVENARLMLDSIKASKKAGAHGDLDNLSEDARAEIEQAEDEFVGQTEEAVSVMKNVLDTPEPLRNLADLIAAQLEFHKKSYEILSELAPTVDALQVEQEVSSRLATAKFVRALKRCFEGYVSFCYPSAWLRILTSGYLVTRIGAEDIIEPTLIVPRCTEQSITCPSTCAIKGSGHSIALVQRTCTTDWSLVIGLVIIIALSTAAWFLSPKGDNQTLFRSTLILTFVSCYLMWAIVFLSQWHPLIAPKRSDIRPDRVPQ
ncbi:unnamed protein product [Penicillium nalgiovense]|nr:unnamed protein product [Penicillium nalgiovense]